MFNYEVSLEKEILREIGAGLLADYNRLLNRHNLTISDKEHALVREYWYLADIYNDLYSLPTEEFGTIKHLFKSTRDYLNKDSVN